MATEATTETRSIPERVATLEEGQRHLATKEDIAELKVLIERAQVNGTRWTVATIIAVGALIIAAVKLL